MKPVRRLAPDVAEKIAAGEVIERPFSVVKELVENALDAGATEIEIRLEQGGKGLIEVTDNGAGMTADDLALCVERHATSKFQKMEDFDRLHTLGFRGEALPSIRAVSQLEIFTRQKGAAGSAYAWTDVGGGRVAEVPSRHFLGSEHGSAFRVAQLFHSIPVRWKFLKSEKSEALAVREWVERLALCHAKTGFSLVTETQNHRWAPATSDQDRIRQVLLDGDDTPIEKVEGRFEDGNYTLFWARGRTTGSSKKLIQKVNGRVLRDRLLQPILLQAFRQHLLPGQYPILFLAVEMDPSTLDVNIHPTKTEVRFLRPSSLIAAIQRDLARLLEVKSSPVWVAGLGPTPAPVAEATMAPRASQPALSFAFAPMAAQPIQTSAPALQPTHHPLTMARYLGDLFATYALFEKDGQSLWLLDQHAAHERVRYEKLKQDPLSDIQTLLLPISVATPPRWEESSVRVLETLKRHGFECEALSTKSLVFRALPAAWAMEPLAPRLQNLLAHCAQESDTSDSTLWDAAMFEAVASEACHSAIRAGDRISEWEARALVDQLFVCEHPWNCPHGRPTLVEIPQARFESWFQRRAPQHHASES